MGRASRLRRPWRDLGACAATLRAALLWAQRFSGLLFFSHHSANASSASRLGGCSLRTRLGDYTAGLVWSASPLVRSLGRAAARVTADRERHPSKPKGTPTSAHPPDPLLILQYNSGAKVRRMANGAEPPTREARTRDSAPRQRRAGRPRSGRNPSAARDRVEDVARHHQVQMRGHHRILNKGVISSSDPRGEHAPPRGQDRKSKSARHLEPFGAEPPPQRDLQPPAITWHPQRRLPAVDEDPQRRRSADVIRLAAWSGL